jgi:hypothetical protein
MDKNKKKSLYEDLKKKDDEFDKEMQEFEKEIEKLKNKIVNENEE